MNRQKTPNSKGAPTHKGLRLSVTSRNARGRKNCQSTATMTSVALMMATALTAPSLTVLTVPLVWLRALIFMMESFR